MIPEPAAWLLPSGVVVHQVAGERWSTLDGFPLRLAPDLAGAVPLYLTTEVPA